MKSRTDSYHFHSLKPHIIERTLKTMRGPECKVIAKPGGYALSTTLNVLRVTWIAENCPSITVTYVVLGDCRQIRLSKLA